MNKRKSILLGLCVIFMLGLFAPACAMLKGDPRKNCNHPKHGEYMKERQQKQFNKKGFKL